MTEYCESCGVLWVEHMGPTGVCAENKRLRTEIIRLRARLKEFEDERRNRRKYETEDWK